MPVARQITIHVAQNPRARLIIRGKLFERYEDYAALDEAVQVATLIRSKACSLYADHWTISEVVDWGPRPGRYRYAVFVRKGREI